MRDSLLHENKSVSQSNQSTKGQLKRKAQVIKSGFATVTDISCTKSSLVLLDFFLRINSNFKSGLGQILTTANIYAKRNVPLEFISPTDHHLAYSRLRIQSSTSLVPTINEWRRKFVLVHKDGESSVTKACDWNSKITLKC